MKFLVTRTDALQNASRHINNSEMWPCVVEASNHEEAVHRAFSLFSNYRSEGFAGKMPKNFLVVAMVDACVVTFREKKDYDVTVQPYCD